MLSTIPPNTVPEPLIPIMNSLAGALKQCWLAFYRSILHTVTASWENVLDNCTILTIPGQYHTILPYYLLHTTCA